MKIDSAAEMIALWVLGIAGEPKRVRPTGYPSERTEVYGATLSFQALRYVESRPGYWDVLPWLRARHIECQEFRSPILDAWEAMLDADLKRSPAFLIPPSKVMAGEDQARDIVASVETALRDRRREVRTF